MKMDPVVPDIFMLHVDQALNAFWMNDYDTALGEFNMALDIRTGDIPTRWSKVYTLLCLARYEEAAELWRTLVAHRTYRWDGAPVSQVTLWHEFGFGDSLMMFRYVEQLKAKVPLFLAVPPPLRRLAEWVHPHVTGELETKFWIGTFDVLWLLKQNIKTIPPADYLKVDMDLVRYWAGALPQERKIGIAWDSNTHHRGEHENGTRSLPLEQFLELLWPVNGRLVSLQHHDRIKANAHGVVTPEYEDFADVAAVASLMDEIICIDTAAVHVAGAIGHPRTYCLLAYVATWRWRNGNVWYPNITLCQQPHIGDWRGAFEKLKLKRTQRWFEHLVV
jgi:hypothetical protein